MLKWNSDLINFKCHGESKPWLPAFALQNEGPILALSDNSETVPLMKEGKVMAASYSSGGQEELRDIQLTSASAPGGWRPVLQAKKPSLSMAQRSLWAHAL